MRIKGLDAVRGIGAAMVVAHHTLGLFASPEVIAKTPLLRFPDGLLFNGDLAVVVFFVLSGFVLTYALETGDDPRFLPFFLKRVVRLYIPYGAAILGSLGLIAILDAIPAIVGPHPALTMPVRPLNYASLFLMIGAPGDGNVDAPVWSIFIEMQAVILMPTLARASKRQVLYIAGALFIVGNAMAWHYFHGVGLPLRHPIGLGAHIATTLFFFQFFAYGSLIYKFRNEIADLVSRAGKLPTCAAATLSIICIFGFLFYKEQFGYLLDTVPACFIVAICSTSAIANRLLTKPFTAYLGKISFSLYLVHLPIILFGSTLLAPRVGLPFAVAISVVLAFVVAYFFNLLIERPSGNLSHRISRRQKAVDIESSAAAQIDR